MRYGALRSSGQGCPHTSLCTRTPPGVGSDYALRRPTHCSAHPNPAFRRHHPIHRTVGLSPGEGSGEGTPSPPARTIPAILQGSHAGAGVLATRARGGRKSGAPAHTPLRPPHPRLRRSSPALGAGAVVAISPARAQAQGRPARGGNPDPAFCRHHPIHWTVGDIARGGARGGNPLPVVENHTGPPIGLPRRSGGSRGKSPGRAEPGLPPPAAPFAGILPYTVPWGYRLGRGPGREPPPRRREPHSPPTELPRRSGGSHGESPGRAQARGAGFEHAFRRHLTTHCSPISPTPPAPSALLPRPQEGGSSRDIPRKGTSTGKAGPGCRPGHAFAGIIPCGGPWGYHPGRTMPPLPQSPHKATLHQSDLPRSPCRQSGARKKPFDYKITRGWTCAHE